MPFNASFTCLWCGTAHTTRSAEDLEGWAQLCPECIGKAGENGFLRYRLKQALRERATVARGDRPETREQAAVALADIGEDPSADRDLERDMVDYYEARAPEYDDWYLRRGRFERGAIHDAPRPAK